ncbi:MAG: magnesium transporter MgtC [Rhodocyclales bacterium GWA2_65_20]|nr:MAG: magnesium transporter MgtC [Rhodocyclales bacterium GWA2_65_20]
MNIFAATAPEQVQAFAISLAIGLLIGIERERRVEPKAGLRTFALVGMLGCLFALIAERSGSGWILAVGLLAVAAMMIAAIVTDPQDDPGTTSVVALMLCYGLGAAVWFGYATLAVMAAIAATALLYFKTELHGMTTRLTHKDLISVLQFAVLSFVVLPILPDQDFGPYGAFNPHQIWWMVVLISGVSLAGYAALRLIGSEHGAAVIGFFGGLVSSTATTMVFARHARAHEDIARTATLVILLANLMVTLRLAFVASVVAPTLLVPLAVMLGAGLLPGLLVTLYGWRSLKERGDLPMPEVTNPTEIRTALSFGLLYGVVLFLSAWLEDIAGSKGLYIVALASGLTDVDAITLSTLRLYNLERLSQFQAVASIALAILANLSFKIGLVIAIGGMALAKRTLPGLLAFGMGLGAGLAILA